jgi:hypothetical protein
MRAAAALALFAQTRTEPFLRKTEDWVVVGLLTATLLGAAAILWFVERWRKGSLGGTTRDSAQELTNFRAMFERGEITEDEYNKLRLKVAERVKPPAPPAPPTTDQPTPVPPPAPPNGQPPPA